MATTNTNPPVARTPQFNEAPSIWKDRSMGTIIAFALVALAGLLVSFILPRGPTTQTQGLLLLAGSAILGVIAGRLMRSGWGLLLFPVIHIAVLEWTRPDLLGPTVGPIRLDDTFGILAFVVGRGLYGLVAIVPMVLGTAIGVWLGNLSAKPSGVSLWVLPLLATATLVVLAVWLALPARTPPILDANGQPIAGSISELSTVRLGGLEQAIMVRAHSADKPVLLYLNGGPGQSGLPFSRVMLEDLTKNFVVVDWDQRGTGKSYVVLEPTATLTLERAINDTIELAEHLRTRFREQKIYVLGESWGSTLGVLAVQRRPDLFHAFIGSGQMVSQRVTDQRLYHDVLDLAARTGNSGLADKMRSYGLPPYADIPFANGFVMQQYDALYKPYTPSAAYIERGSKAGIGPYGVFASEYNLIEKFNVLRGLMDMFTVMYPQLQQLDFRQDVPRLEVPVYVLDGAAELSARREPMLEWFNTLEAPRKQLFTLENAAHSVAFEQYETLNKIMLETVLPETYYRN